MDRGQAELVLSDLWGSNYLLHFSRGWVSVNDDITDYLPETTETKQGLTIMENHFTTFGSAHVMVSNITYEQALSLAGELECIDGISSVDMGDEDDAEDRADHYRDSAVLYDVTFDGEEDDPTSLEAMDQMKQVLSLYDASISSTVGENGSEMLAAEISFIMKLVAVIVIAVLLLTSKSYGEVPVLLITFDSSYRAPQLFCNDRDRCLSPSVLKVFFFILRPVWVFVSTRQTPAHGSNLIDTPAELCGKRFVR